VEHSRARLELFPGRRVRQKAAELMQPATPPGERELEECYGCLQPLRVPLLDQRRPVATDVRGHGLDRPPPQPLAERRQVVEPHVAAEVFRVVPALRLLGAGGYFRTEPAEGAGQCGVVTPAAGPVSVVQSEVLGHFRGRLAADPAVAGLLPLLCPIVGNL